MKAAVGVRAEDAEAEAVLVGDGEAAALAVPPSTPLGVQTGVLQGVGAGLGVATLDGVAAAVLLEEAGALGVGSAEGESCSVAVRVLLAAALPEPWREGEVWALAAQQVEGVGDGEGGLVSLPFELALLLPPPPLPAEGVGNWAVAHALLENKREALPAPAVLVPWGATDGVPPKAVALGRASALAVPTAVPAGVLVACTPLGVAPGLGDAVAHSVISAEFEGRTEAEARSVNTAEVEGLWVPDAHPEAVPIGDGEAEKGALGLSATVAEMHGLKEVLAVEDGVGDCAAVPLTPPVGVAGGVALGEGSKVPVGRADVDAKGEDVSDWHVEKVRVEKALTE